jgi:nicotinate phosphoribosyltransferase
MGNSNEKLNLTMLCDFYELTMGNGYFNYGYADRITYFDLFYRRVPDDGGYAIAAGLEQVIDYIQNLHFSAEDIEFLRSRGNLQRGLFADYLANFKFTATSGPCPRAHRDSPRSPLLTVRAPAIQAQLLETFLCWSINHQSQLSPPRPAASCRRPPAGRCWSSVPAGPRAPTAPSWAPRRPISAAVPARPAPSSDQLYGVRPAAPWPTPGCRCSTASTRPSRPTARSIPTTATLLVDTYNTLTERRYPDAIRAFNDVLKPRGITKCGIRLDSG